MSYRRRLQGLALEEYRHDRLVWALLTPHSKRRMKAPEVPAILKRLR